MRCSGGHLSVSVLAGRSGDGPASPLMRFGTCKAPGRSQGVQTAHSRQETSGMEH